MKKIWIISFIKLLTKKVWKNNCLIINKKLDFDILISQNLDQIIIELLNLIYFDKNLEPPHYSLEVIKESFQNLANKFQINISEILFVSKQSDRISKIILYFNEKLSILNRKNEKIRLIKIFGNFIDMLEEKICECNFLRGKFLIFKKKNWNFL